MINIRARYINLNNIADFKSGLWYNIGICKPHEEIPGFKDSGKHLAYNPNKVYILNHNNGEVWVWEYKYFFNNWVW